MARLNNIISQIVNNNYKSCCLCFKDCGEILSGSGDEVVLEINGNVITKSVDDILKCVLGGIFDEHLKTIGPMCEVCTRVAIDSYKFIQTCRQNLEQLTYAIDTFAVGFDNTTEDMKNFKSIFVSVDIKNCSSQHFYDVKFSGNSKEKAHKRFQLLSQLQNNKKSVANSDSKKRIKKRHNLKDESFLQICELIKEKKTPTRFKCKVCSNIFNKSGNFKKHYYSQHSPKILKCSECSRSYGSETLLKQHKYDCHSDMVCSECGKTYKNRYSLLYHMRRHTGEEPYECKYCGQKFLWASRRAEHIRRMHLEPSVECDICHTKFRALSSLYDHRKRHFNPNSRLHIVIGSQEVTEESMITDWEASTISTQNTQSEIHS